jgi:hypothetical protein
MSWRRMVFDIGIQLYDSAIHNAVLFRIATAICDHALTAAAQRLVASTGASGCLFPLLNKLAAFQNGRLIESTLEGARPQDIGLLVALELVRLNTRRNFELNVVVDPSPSNGRLVNWGEQREF